MKVTEAVGLFLIAGFEEIDARGGVDVGVRRLRFREAVENALREIGYQDLIPVEGGGWQIFEV